MGSKFLKKVNKTISQLGLEVDKAFDTQLGNNLFDNSYTFLTIQVIV